MTNATRRLSAEMRETLAISFPSDMNDPLADALHDLDVADRELAAAQATIAQQSGQLAERLEDVVVLSDKLKFAEMDNYTKESAIADYNQRLKEQAKKLTQQGAVIAAMREALGELHATVKGECPGLLNEDCGGNARLDLSVEAALADAAQLAADHDAAVRADERRKVLEDVKQICHAMVEEVSDCLHTEYRQGWEVAIERINIKIDKLTQVER